MRALAVLSALLAVSLIAAQQGGGGGGDVGDGDGLGGSGGGGIGGEGSGGEGVGENTPSETSTKPCEMFSGQFGEIMKQFITTLEKIYTNNIR